MAEKFLEIKNLTVQSGGETLFDNINFTIHQNEQWAIIGSSGSGKTLLAQVLAGKYFYNGKIEYYFPDKKK